MAGGPFQKGVELPQQRPGGEALPLLAEKSLVARSAGGAKDFPGEGHAGELGHDPVAMLHKSDGPFRHCRGMAGAVQDFGPEPLAGILPLMAGIVCFPGGKGGVDLFRLRNGAVVLPEIKHGVALFLKALQQGQGAAAAVYGNRSGAGGIKGDADNAPALRRAQTGDAVLHSPLQGLQMVQRALPVDLLIRKAIHSPGPAGIIGRGPGGNLPIFCAAGHTAHRGGSKINTENIVFHDTYSLSCYGSVRVKCLRIRLSNHLGIL